MNISFKKFFVVLFTSLFTCYSAADWQLEQEHSTINFNSVKNEHIIESHHFNRFSATISEQGKVSLKVYLTSVDTNIAIRDQRMQDHLFNTNLFSQATFSAQLNTEELESVAIGSSKSIKVTGEIDLHGQQQSVDLKVLVTKLSKAKLLVVNQERIDN